MSPLMILAVVFVGLTLIGVPLFVSVGLTTALALFLIDIPYTLMAQTGYGSLTPFPLLTIPLFVLAGRLMEVGGMANRMIAIATNLVGVSRFDGAGNCVCLYVVCGLIRVRAGDNCGDWFGHGSGHEARRL